MNASDTDLSLEARARRRVGIKTGLYIHTLVFVLVNLGLLTMNLVAGGHRWSVWPLWGWGLGLGIHALVAMLNLRGDGWRQRMLAREMEHLRRHQP